MFGLRKSTRPAAAVPAGAGSEHVQHGPAAHSADAPTSVLSHPEVMLGALRSEFDQNRTVAAAFTTLGEVTEQVLDVYRLGKVDAGTAVAALRVLRVEDLTGTQWTMGATTRRWYRKLPGGAWRIAVPPTLSDAGIDASCETAVTAVQELLGVDPNTVAPAMEQVPSPLTFGPDTAPNAQAGVPAAAPQTDVLPHGDDEASKLLQAFLQQTGQLVVNEVVNEVDGDAGYGD